jgi:hypothetical protein
MVNMAELIFCLSRNDPADAPEKRSEQDEQCIRTGRADPEGIRKAIVNWEQIAKALLEQAHRMAAWARDDTMRELIAALLAYPGVPSRWHKPDLEAPLALVLPIELDLGGGQLARMFSTVTTLATPQDVTLQELHIEAFYPADEQTGGLDFFKRR